MTDVGEPQLVLGLNAFNTMPYLENFLDNSGEPPCESLTPGIKVSNKAGYTYVHNASFYDY